MYRKLAYSVGLIALTAGMFSFKIRTALQHHEHNILTALVLLYIATAMTIASIVIPTWISWDTTSVRLLLLLLLPQPAQLNSQPQLTITSPVDQPTSALLLRPPRPLHLPNQRRLLLLRQLLHALSHTHHLHQIPHLLHPVAHRLLPALARRHLRVRHHNNLPARAARRQAAPRRRLGAAKLPACDVRAGAGGRDGDRGAFVPDGHGEVFRRVDAGEGAVVVCGELGCRGVCGGRCDGYVFGGRGGGGV